MRIRGLVLVSSLFISSNIISAQDFAFILPSIVNIRSGPGMNFEVVTQLRQGTIKSITSKSGNWIELNLGSKSGYVSKRIVFSTSTDNIANEFKEQHEVNNFNGYQYKLKRVNYKKDVPIFIAVYPTTLPRDDDIILSQMVNHISKVWGINNIYTGSAYIQKQAGTNLIVFDKESKKYYFLLIKDEISARTGVLVFWCKDSNWNLVHSKGKYHGRNKHTQTSLKSNTSASNNKIYTLGRKTQTLDSDKRIEQYMNTKYSQFGVISVDAVGTYMKLNVNTTLYSGFMVGPADTKFILTEMINQIKRFTLKNNAKIDVFYLSSKVITAESRSGRSEIDIIYHD
ncbi:hypothetical protein E3V36_04560 [Candidatus Marinimicrobia bacterium MT.SAG.2]|nr:hypothetical protein E3V36_04560 [Candidatus Marinimicrobia bacterium MT.SAG.2]